MTPFIAAKNWFGYAALAFGAALCLGATARAAPGDPAFCFAAAIHGNRQLAFDGFCRSIETALADNGDFQRALEQRRRISAKLLFTALPTGEIAAALFATSSGDTLIDDALMTALSRQRFAPRSDHPETFILPVALQPVENFPGAIYRIGD